MKLEQEIKQPKFRNEYHKVAVNLIYTFNWLAKAQTELFKKHDITGNQFNILRILRGQYPKPAAVCLLRERMLDKMSDASRLVERLRVKGLVQRELSQEDRRRVDVKITDKGLKLLAEIDRMNDHYDELLKKLSPTEATKLNNLLDKLRG